MPITVAPLSFLILTSLVPTIQAQWSLSGCYGAIFGSGNDWGELITLPTTPLRAQDCVSACTNRNAGFAIIRNAECYCRPAAGFDQKYIYVNPAECRVQCSDGFPCGDSLTPRVSVYNITGTALQSPSPLVSSISSSITTTTSSRTTTLTVSSAAAPSSPSRNSSTPSTTTSEGSVDSSPERNTNRAALIGGVIGGVITLLLAGFLIFNKWRKNRNLQTIPHLDALAAKTFLAGGTAGAAAIGPSSSFANDPQDPYLLPNILPRTPNMIYSVVTSHSPSSLSSSSKDEIPLQTDEVVAVRGYFKDGWGVGTNVNTGATGAFPLGCLVSDEKWAKKGFVPPERVDSVEGARKVMREASRRRRKEYQGSNGGSEGTGSGSSIFASLGRASFGRSSSKGSSGYGTGVRRGGGGGGGEYQIPE